jgi:hypothetical protein
MSDRPKELSNVRDYLGWIIGRKVVDVTADEPNGIPDRDPEDGDTGFIMLHFDNHGTLAVPLTEAGLSYENPWALMADRGELQPHDSTMPEATDRKAVDGDRSLLPEAVDVVPSGTNTCRAVMPGYTFTCDLPRGHEGLHQAWSCGVGDSQLLRTWRQDSTAISVRSWFRQMRAADFERDQRKWQAWSTTTVERLREPFPDTFKWFRSDPDEWTLFDTQQVVERETRHVYDRPRIFKGRIVTILSTPYGRNWVHDIFMNSGPRKALASIPPVKVDGVDPPIFLSGLSVFNPNYPKPGDPDYVRRQTAARLTDLPSPEEIDRLLERPIQGVDYSGFTWLGIDRSQWQSGVDTDVKVQRPEDVSPEDTVTIGLEPHHLATGWFDDPWGERIRLRDCGLYYSADRHELFLVPNYHLIPANSYRVTRAAMYEGQPRCFWISPYGPLGLVRRFWTLPVRARVTVQQPTRVARLESLRGDPAPLTDWR